MTDLQPNRLVDYLEFDPNDDFDDRVFEAYLKLYDGADDRTLYVVEFGNYEMYWKDDSPGSTTIRAAVDLLGLRTVESGKHSETWFAPSNTQRLVDAGFDVRVVRWTDGDLTLEAQL